MKTSTGKVMFPGRKQVWRRATPRGEYAGDVLGLATEAGPQAAEPLLECVMRDGKRLIAAPALADVRAQAQERIARLPAAVRQLSGFRSYPVEISRPLATEQRKLAAAAAGR